MNGELTNPHNGLPIIAAADAMASPYVYRIVLKVTTAVDVVKKTSEGVEIESAMSCQVLQGTTLMDMDSMFG